MENTELLRIQRIEVKNLFNLYHHTIDLKLDDRITILHGLNGVGKTVILSMIHALFSGKFRYFTNIPFQEFSLTLTDGQVVSISESSDKTNPRGLILSSKDSSGKETGSERLTNLVDLFALTEKIPWLTQLDENRWLDERRGDEIDVTELVHRYGDSVPTKQKKRRFPQLTFFHELQQSVSVHLIETQRLFKVPSDRSMPFGRSESMLVPTVTEYANDLLKRIKETMAEYGQTSQKLDQSFPQRLLTHSNQIPPESLKKRMDELVTKRIKLQEIGILDEAPPKNFMPELDSLDNIKKDVMTLYVEDTENKLKVLNDLSTRIRVFIENLNNKFQNKTIDIDRQKGFLAKGKDEKILPLNSLSSGEQHELILHYDLLFKVRPNTLVLIDEPELSLHLSWQKRFLQDLLETVSVANFDALIATHSPFIIGDRSDLMVALDSDRGNPSDV